MRITIFGNVKDRLTAVKLVDPVGIEPPSGFTITELQICVSEILTNFSEENVG